MSSSGRVAELQRRLSKVSCALDGARRDLKRRARQTNKAEAQRSLLEGLIYLTNGHKEASEQVARRLQIDPAVVDATFQRVMLHTSAEEMQVHLMYWTSSDDALAQKARTKCQEWQLVEWLTKQNVVNGRAPQNRELLEYKARLQQTQTVTPRYSPRDASAHADRSWCRRFCERWAIKRGVLRSKDNGSRDQVREQVCAEK